MSTLSLLAWGVAVQVGAVRAGASPAPAEVVDTPPPELVTPGTVGFLVTFFVAVALVLLVLDMVRRNRRIDVRAARRDEELRAAEAAALAAPGPDDASDPRPDGDDGQGPRGPAGPPTHTG